MCPGEGFTTDRCGDNNQIYMMATNYKSETFNHYTSSSSNYIGCYTNMGGSTVMKGSRYSSFPLNTIDICIKFCSMSGYRYAGVENGYFNYRGGTER